MAGISVLRHQFECNFFPLASNQQRDMRLLHSFGLIDRAMNLVILSFESGLVLCPHGENNLDRLTQLPQAFGWFWTRITIGTKLLLEITCPNA